MADFINQNGPLCGGRASAALTGIDKGHKPSTMAEKHQRRRPLDLLRMWRTRIEAFMLEEAAITPPAEDAKPLRVLKAQ